MPATARKLHSPSQPDVDLELALPTDELDDLTDAAVIDRLRAAVLACGSTATVAAGVGIAASTLTRLLNAVWPLSEDSRAKAIEYLRQERMRAADAAAGVSGKLVPTASARTVEKLCRLCMATNSMGFLIGPSGAGKTASLSLFARRNPASIHVQIDASVNASGRMLEELWIRAGFRYRGKVRRSRAADDGNIKTRTRRRSHSHATPSLRRQFTDLVDKLAVPEGQPSTAIILVDDAHKAADTVLELLRELHDACGVAVVLCGTARLSRLDAGGSDCQQWEQIVGRVGIRRMLTGHSDEDVVRIAKAWMPAGAEMTAAARDYLVQLASLPGRIRLVKTHASLAYRLGDRWAIKSGEPMDAIHLRRAHKLLAAVCESCGRPVDDCTCGS